MIQCNKKYIIIYMMLNTITILTIVKVLSITNDTTIEIDSFKKIARATNNRISFEIYW